MSLEYTVVHSKRKTLTAKVLPDGSVEVRAPLFVSDEYISDFVKRYAEKIEKSVERITAAKAEKEAFGLHIGSKILYLGREYEIRAKAGNRVGFDNDGFFAPPDIDGDDLKACIVSLYKKLAKNYILKCVSEESANVGKSPKSVRINSAKTRWGSCSGRDTVNFSWFLLMADEECVRYVVIHELCHMFEHNHSARFWAKVEEFAPNYRACKKRLDELTVKLSREDWEI